MIVKFLTGCLLLWTQLRLGLAYRMRLLPKILIHEHLDCSPRPTTMLELWSKLGWQKAKLPFPKEVIRLWERAQSTHDPREAIRLRKKAAEKYQKYVAKYAGKSLKNYVDAVVLHVLPTMQSAENLTRIMRERIEDAGNDGIIALEIRFAPQLHTMNGLSLNQVMDAVIAGLNDAPIPVDLTLCALRHENAEMARQLGNLCLAYEDYVGCFDLAADEAMFPGVLDWFLKEAVRVRKLRGKSRRPIKIKCHLWETNYPATDDLTKLDANAIDILGHGIRGSLQGNRILEVCPTSNVVTGQIASFKEHPIDRLYRAGKRVTVNTDGTLFTELKIGLSDEYAKLWRYFHWQLDDFYQVNLTALEASNFPPEVKARLRKQLADFYLQDWKQFGGFFYSNY